MIKNNIIPAYILRLYIWDLLKNNTSIATVNDKIPIVPLGEEPEMSDSGKTYLVYGYTEQNAVQVKQIKRGSFSVRIIARSFSELGELMTVITRALENNDESAANVNLWSSHFPNGQFLGLKFTTLEVNYVEGGTPADTEQGPIEGLINISYEYITHQEVKLFNGSTWS